MLNTWVIAAHGMVVTDPPPSSSKVQEITIPKNTIVIMPCFSTYTYCDWTISAKIHALVTNTMLPKLLNATHKTSISEYVNYLYDVVGEYMNEFCIFIDKCPNIKFETSKEESKKAFSYVGKIKPYSRTKSKTFVNTRSIKESYLNGIISKLDVTRSRKNNFHIVIVHTCAVSPNLSTDFKFENGIPLSIQGDTTKIINPDIIKIFTSRIKPDIIIT
jgi:hypothetical protein